jgi:GGDEF domain-containing protein
MRESSMDKRFSWIFLLASGAFFVFIVGLTGYRIEDARRKNLAAAHEEAVSLAAKAQSLRDTSGGFQSAQFRRNMRDVFDGEPRLILLSIHSPDDGMLYLVSRSRSTLRDPAVITPDWRGNPVYALNRGYDTQVTRLLESDGSQTRMDAIFVVMGREDLYPVVRDDLFLFLAFLLVCGVLILIVMSVQQDVTPERKRGSAPAATPDAPASAAPPSPDRASPDEARPLQSPRTGLVWAEYLEPRLKAELERAASSDQDLALARLRIDEPYADGRLPLVHAEIARLLKASFPLHDLLFEAGGDSYAIVFPDTDIDAAVRAVEVFRKKVAAASIEGGSRSLSAGVSSRGGRLIDEKVLREESDIAVAKASREGGNQVIGFRADPARFRESLTLPA